MAIDLFPRYAVGDVERIVVGGDGIPALVVRPQTTRPCPGVLMQHGYGSSKHDLLPLAMLLASYGFVGLLPDAWGHGDRFPASGPNWMSAASADFFLEVVRRTLDDMREALTALLALPGVREDAVIAGGFSMGAMAALVLGTEDERVAGVISVSGSPLPDLLSVRLFGADGPSAATAGWAREHDAAAHIGRLAPKPLLLQHGRADDMVPVGGTLRLYEAAQPFYAAHPDRLALMLYDHTHLVTEAEIADGVGWLLPFFAPPASE